MSFGLMMAKGFRPRPIPDGRSRWDVSVADDESVTINGQVIRQVDLISECKHVCPKAAGPALDFTPVGRPGCWRRPGPNSTWSPSSGLRGGFHWPRRGLCFRLAVGRAPLRQPVRRSFSTDRWRHSTTMISVDVLRAVLLLVLSVAGFMHFMSLPLLMVLAGCIALLTAAFDPSLQATLPTIAIDPDILSRDQRIVRRDEAHGPHPRTEPDCTGQRVSAEIGSFSR